MSEYQYYEFQTIDRPLNEADRKALRALSTRARITATSFTNTYEWGDFKGDPTKMMERWFDLHLYLANWGTRQLMIRLPKRLFDRRRLDGYLRNVDCATLRVAGENLILDIQRDELGYDDEYFEDGTGCLARLAPLRADLLAGDLRLFYLLWLTAVEEHGLDEDEPEPMPGIGPMTGALEAFAEFFGLDPDLVEAAAERSADAMSGSMPPGAVKKLISAMTDREKTGMLVRVFDGDPHAAGELRAEVQSRGATQSGARPVVVRTVGDLRARAYEIGLVRDKAATAKVAAAEKRQAQEAEKARRARLDAIARRGDKVWIEVEAEIERRNATGYGNAVNLLADLRVIAEERGKVVAFSRRVKGIRERHARKERFLERLAGLA